MNILFLTDSLGYPRNEPPEITAAQTWTYSVRDKFTARECGGEIKFYFDMKPGRDSSSLIWDVDNHIKAYEPDIVVLQVGIVDCYARALKKIERQILSRIPLVNTLTRKFISRYYTQIIKMRDIAYVSKFEFKENMNYLKESFGKTNWIVVPIAPASQSYCRLNPLIFERISRYNEILHEVFRESYSSLLYQSANTEELYLGDNHHLSKYGHEHLSGKVSEELSKLLEMTT